MSIENLVFFVVAREPSLPGQPKELIERFFQFPDGPPGEHLERAKKRQRELRFDQGWDYVFIHEAKPMKFRDGDFVVTLDGTDCPSEPPALDRRARDRARIQEVLDSIPPPPEETAPRSGLTPEMIEKLKAMNLR